MDSRTGLPSRDAVLAACRGFPPIEDVVLLDAAGELTVLHQAREHSLPCEVEEIDWHRARLMCAIDDWVVESVPAPGPDARVHTQTMGQVIDRLAQVTVHAYVALVGAPDRLFLDTADQLTALAAGYQDLADELEQGLRRLPDITIPW